ncbi:MAG: exodeoxyribonuclease VII large subunit [Candidatus Omnitrophota bacterium]|jgi:exodeoxyribonuclease VII large subunit
MDNLFKIEKVYTIQELNGTVRKLIRDQFPEYVWVCGEIQDLRDRGTINLNLVQKHTEANELIAQAKAVIFENVRPQIDRRIKETNGAFEFRKDIEVKLLCKVDLYVKTGQFSLTVFDIDPVYTLGKMAQSRQKIIEELRAKGLFEKNKLVPMPLIPLKVGLITSPDSAAYHDVIDEFKKSKYGFNIFVYGCYMQGKLVENDVVSALNFFNNLSFDELDAIMIARGGGSTADLSWFDNKKIAETIAFLKFPLISAIGHEINTSITDMVAHTFVKTPTKGAQFLTERVKNFLDSLTDFEQKISMHAEDFLEDNKARLGNLAVKIDSAVPRYLRGHKEELLSKKVTIDNFTKRFLELKNNELTGNVSVLKLHLSKIFKSVTDDLSHKESKIRLLDPHNVLKRGYSITFKADKAIKSIDDVEENDMIKTVLYKGNIVSEVKNKVNQG